MATYTFSKLETIGLIIFLCLLSQPVHAEDMFSWRDTSGHTFFGSHPPEKATDLKKLPSHTISHYSSDKVVSGFRLRDKKSYPILSKNHSKNALTANKEQHANDTPAHLSYQSPQINLNERGDISACSVTVHNEGKSPALDVVVQLTFRDGTFITAIGPDKLEPGEQAIFDLPSNSIPLRISNTQDKEQKTSDALTPEVTVSYN